MRLVLLLVIACMSVAKPKAKIDEYGYAVIHEEKTNRLGNGPVVLEFFSYERLLAEALAGLENRMLDSLSKAEALKQVPPYGRCMVTIKRSTIAAASPDYFEFVVLQDGEEVQRLKGERRTPSLDQYNWWYGMDMFSLESPIDSAITVYVVDNLHASRDRFTIRDVHYPHRKK